MFQVIPLIVLSGMSVIGGIALLMRNNLKHPQLVWSKRNPEPWNQYGDKEFKVHNVLYWSHERYMYFQLYDPSGMPTSRPKERPDY